MIRSALDRLYLWSGYIAGLFMVAIFLLMIAMSAGRPIGINVPAGDDLVAWCMAAMAFLGASYTFRSGEMIKVGLVIDRLNETPRRIAYLVALLIGTAFIGFFAWNAVNLTYDSWRFNDMAQGVLAIPLWIPQLGYSGGLVILFIAFVDELLNVAAGGVPRCEKPRPKTAEEAVEQAVQSGV